MKHLCACPRCGGTRIWHVRTMHERGDWTRPQEMAVAFSLGRSYGLWETFACDSCGHTDWYAHEFQPTGHLARPPAAHERPPAPCADCNSHEFWFVGVVRERDHEGDPIELGLCLVGKYRVEAHGHFSVAICRRCGLAVWRAHELRDSVVEKLLEAHKRDRPCPACDTETAFTIARVLERGDYVPTALHVTLREGLFWAHAAGSFAVEICTSCHVVEWLARDRHQLAHDPAHGVVLIEATRSAPQEGPYR